MLGVESELRVVDGVEWDGVERERWGLNRLVRKRLLIELRYLEITSCPEKGEFSRDKLSK